MRQSLSIRLGGFSTVPTPPGKFLIVVHPVLRH